MECIILAGGLGTRLRGSIGDQPKCMAPVNGKPFLHYLFEYLEQQRCTRLILSLGHKHEAITEWLQIQDRPYEISYVIEHEPLGTGGGIRLALEQSSQDEVLVLNGDTFFPVPLADLISFHRNRPAAASIALKSMQDFERYGTVTMEDNGMITDFSEKQHREHGLINGGIYCIDRAHFLKRELPSKFSFEKDYLERFVTEHGFFGYSSDAYFIDIGIPADYEKAQYDFADMFRY
jgi:D-glycero-alpha-D-manno-heptose 1-phosphate guanylyltransferase